MQNYRNFEYAFRRAVKDELDMGVANASRKHLLEAALNENSQINLSLISNLSVRERLRQPRHGDVLKIDNVKREAGTPGIYVPSTNAMQRRSAVFLTSRDATTTPVGSLISGATFSIDPRAEVGAFTDPMISLRMRNKRTSFLKRSPCKNDKSRNKTINKSYC